MLNMSRDIHSLSSFKRNTLEFLQQMKQTGKPVVLKPRLNVSSRLISYLHRVIHAVGVGHSFSSTIKIR